MALKLPDTGAEILPDGRRMVPSAQRNAGPILEVLQGLSLKGRLLEIASGSGLHAAEMAGKLALDWQPTDVDPANLASIRAWSAFAQGTIRAPILLDATALGWSRDLGHWDAILLVNLLHLIHTPAAETLLTEVASALTPGGTFCLYGPFLRDGQPTSPGDRAFDASLRSQGPGIGYKDLAWVQDRLARHGLTTQVVAMPANNLMLLAKHGQTAAEPQKAG